MNAESVADLAFGLMLSVARKIVPLTGKPDRADGPRRRNQAVQQDAGNYRLRRHRQKGCQAGERLQHEGAGLRSMDR